MSELQNCTCRHYQYTSRRKNGKGTYQNKVRSFRIGCPVHDKSLFTNPGVVKQ